MKKLASLFLTLLFSTNIFAGDYSKNNPMNAKLFKEIQQKEGTTIDPNETKVTLIISKGKEILIPDFIFKTLIV